MMSKWINMEDEGRPDYYKAVEIKYTDKDSNLWTTIATMVSDGDKYYWCVINSDRIIYDEDVHLWREID